MKRGPKDCKSLHEERSHGLNHVFFIRHQEGSPRPNRFMRKGPRDKSLHVTKLTEWMRKDGFEMAEDNVCCHEFKHRL